MLVSQYLRFSLLVVIALMLKGTLAHPNVIQERESTFPPPRTCMHKHTQTMPFKTIETVIK